MWVLRWCEQVNPWYVRVGCRFALGFASLAAIIWSVALVAGLVAYLVGYKGAMPEGGSRLRNPIRTARSVRRAVRMQEAARQRARELNPLLAASEFYED
jgi:hypothetical protein